MVVRKKDKPLGFTEEAHWRMAEWSVLNIWNAFRRAAWRTGTQEVHAAGAKNTDAEAKGIVDTSSQEEEIL
jgi:hypothetical protein